MPRIHELKCFGRHAGAGNTALVIEGDRRDAAARQAFASRQQASACAFIDGDDETGRADGGYQGRNFNHLDPAREDSATGVAAGALTLHLQTGLTLYQGEQLGRPCVMHTRLDGGKVLLGGAVEFVNTWEN